MVIDNKNAYSTHILFTELLVAWLVGDMWSRRTHGLPHPFYFTTANALMAGGHNHTISTLTTCRSVLLEHARIIFNSHACKFLPVPAAESSSPESSSSASVSDSGCWWITRYGLILIWFDCFWSPSTYDTSDSSLSMEETVQDRLRSPESLLLSLMVADCSQSVIYNIFIPEPGNTWPN